MTDVLKLALDRRAELHEELSKLDDFIRMAEVLIRNSQARTVPSETDEVEPAMPKRPVRVAEPVLRSQARRTEVENEATAEAAATSRPQVIRRISGE